MLRWLFGVIFGVLALLLSVLVLLRWLPPPTTAYMLQSPTRPVQNRWAPASGIAEVARRAVVASEDQKFWTHDGFDVEAIQKAYEENQKSKKGRVHPRGASTISQQTAKNLFLWPGGGYFRKGVEALLTVLIEHLWNKPRILEMYLNIVEFGPGIYGVEAASRAYFGKSAVNLSPQEAARLAAVLPNPRHWSVRTPGPYVQSRVNWILGQMGYGAPVEEPEPAGNNVDDNAGAPNTDNDDPAASGG
jgi:monofunctional biosynthetic peptidoglycan transglycosylase